VSKFLEHTESEHVSSDSYFRDSISIFGGAPLPWTNEQANALSAVNKNSEKASVGVAGKKRSPEELAALKANLVKPVISKKPTENDAPKEKKKFGFF
jgi:hypothetical protein